MRVLLVHNFYRDAGGEDTVFVNERRMLSEHGHEVEVFTRSSAEVRGPLARARAGLGLIFSFSTRRRLRKHIKAFRPDVVHVHNFFPLLTPSVFYACGDEGVPVVFTLHNYRILCPTSTLYFAGAEELRSLSGSTFWAINKPVYRSSRLATLALCLMIEFHKRVGTWKHRVTRFVALTETARQVFAAAGLPPDRIAVKGNHSPFSLEHSSVPIIRRPRALYVGRLSEEKGIDCLLNAWKDLEIDLDLVGDGPMMNVAQAAKSKRIQIHGRLPTADVRRLMGEASTLILPSVCHEMFPMVLLEAFSARLPIVASRIGASRSLIENGVTGMLFEPGNASDLQDKVRWVMENPHLAQDMAESAHRRADAFSPRQSYERLISIYEEAIADLMSQRR
jgi:glycosyltransferase involved in cell wall biosynthesis